MEIKLKSFLKVSLLSLCILILGCGEEAAQQNTQKKKELTIAWVGPLSGPVSLLGVDNLKAVQLSVEIYNKNKTNDQPMVKLIYRDDTYDSQKSKSIIEEVVSKEEVSVVILSTYSAMFLIKDIVKKNNLIVINPIDNDLNLSKLPHSYFMIAKQTEALGSVIASDMIDHSQRQNLILHFNADEFMPVLAKQVNDLLLKAGHQTQMHGYPPGTKKFAPYLKDLDIQKIDSIAMLGYVEAGIAMKEFRDLGFKGQFYTPNSAPGLVSNAKDAANGMRFPDFTPKDGNSAKTEKFLKLYEAKYGNQPMILWTALQAWDSVDLLLASIKESGDQTKIKSYILKTKDFIGACGDITIKPDGSSRGIHWNLYEYNQGKSLRLDRKE